MSTKTCDAIIAAIDAQLAVIILGFDLTFPNDLTTEEYDTLLDLKAEGAIRETCPSEDRWHFQIIDAACIQRLPNRKAIKWVTNEVFTHNTIKVGDPRPVVVCRECCLVNCECNK